MSNQPIVNGIGIMNFLKHKTFFITGSTGFIAKVFVEKLLREVPALQNIYLLMRAKNTQHAQQRIQSEIIECELFKKLKEKHGERYEEFMKNILIAVAGKFSHPCLGLEADMARSIADKIDVIVNIAGNTKWHERYDVLLDVNVRGLSRLIEYAMGCKKHILFLHVSTVVVAEQFGVGLVQEKPVRMEETTTNEKQSSNTNAIDIEAELRMANELASSSNISKNKLITEMSKLGIQRAKYHGWYNAYQLTKVMGEMLLFKLRDKVSTVIIRPTYVESSIKEPFSGWIEGYRAMDPMILSYGKGQLQGILGDPTAILDVVPVDMVVNAMIAAASYHGIEDKQGLHIYHIASSMVNPLLCKNMFLYAYNYFTMHPLKTSRNEAIIVKDIEFHSSMYEYIMVGLLEDMSTVDGKLLRNLVRMAAVYEIVMFSKGRFDNSNTQTLFEKMSWEEKKVFHFDVRYIDWEDYFKNIHFNGLRKYVLKENIPITPRL